MPENFKTIKYPDSLKDGDSWGSPGTKKNVDGRVVKYADVGKFGVDERGDIRKAVTIGDTFANQFHKEIKREVSKMNFMQAGQASKDDNLLSDTTLPGDCTVTAIPKPEKPWSTASATKVVAKGWFKEDHMPEKVKRVVELNS